MSQKFFIGGPIQLVRRSKHAGAGNIGTVLEVKLDSNEKGKQYWCYKVAIQDVEPDKWIPQFAFCTPRTFIPDHASNP